MLKQANHFTTDVLNKFDPPPGIHLGDTFRLPRLERILFAMSEISIWTGINGHGKSLILSQLAVDLCETGEKVGIMSFEMTPARTLHRMTRQVTGSYHPAEWLIIQALEWIGRNIWINAGTGTGKPDAMLKAFHQMATDQGVTHFMIDSLMKCGIAEDDYNGQKTFVDRLQNFAHHDNVHVHLVAHARKGQDENTPPGKMDIKGTGTITDLADNVLSVWRNKSKELRTDANGGIVIDDDKGKTDAFLDVVKHRELGGDAEGRYGLFYHRESMQFTGRPADDPHLYIEGARQ